MKILIAGSTGAIGQPLLNLLDRKNYDVYGITQSPDRARLLKERGVTPVLLNVLDREAVIASMAAIKPDIVIDMLTHLPKEYTPEAMRMAAPMDAKIRLEGGAHLLAAAEANGSKRYIVQSSAFWYESGVGLADETTPFAYQASPGVSAGSQLYAQIEKRVLESTKIEGVALRFGFFYGPGTWFHPTGNMAEQVRKQHFPLIGTGKGIWNFVHIEDAVQAIVSALQCPTGAYNIVNNQPVQMREWLPAFAHFVEAPPPPLMTEEEALEDRGADAVYYAIHLRAASNAKAKRILNFQPRLLEWISEK